MEKIINLYCDESCHLEKDCHQTMVIGAIYCPLEDVVNLSYKMKALKEKHKLSRFFEVKWTKVSLSKLSFYEDLIDLFVTSESLKFRAVKIRDKTKLNHLQFKQTHDDWYYKIYYLMLRHIINDFIRCNIYIDIKDTCGTIKIKKLREFLSNTIHDFSKQVIQKIQRIRSHEAELLQLADLLIGAVGYENRAALLTDQKKDFRPNLGKLQLCKMLRERLGIKDFDTSSPYSTQKFNLLLWDAQDE